MQIEISMAPFWKEFLPGFFIFVDQAVTQALQQNRARLLGLSAYSYRVSPPAPAKTTPRKRKQKTKPKPKRIIMQTETTKPQIEDKLFVLTPLHDRLIEIIKIGPQNGERKIMFSSIWSRVDHSLTGKEGHAHQLKVDRELQKLRRAGHLSYTQRDGWELVS